MDKENGVLLHHRERQNYATCWKMELYIIMLDEINQTHNHKYQLFSDLRDSEKKKQDMNIKRGTI
jgi:hypothetical protein